MDAAYYSSGCIDRRGISQAVDCRATDSEEEVPEDFLKGNFWLQKMTQENLRHSLRPGLAKGGSVFSTTISAGTTSPPDKSEVHRVGLSTIGVVYPWKECT